MLAKSSIAFATFALALACGTGCSASEAPSPDATGDESEIIGGKNAFESELDAVARLDTPSGSFCGGTLVAPRLVMTAAHCVEGYDGQGHERTMAAHFMSYDAQGGVRSEKAFTVAGILRFGVKDRIGFQGRPGKDIALLMLDEAVPSSVAKPIPVRAKPLSDADVGKPFVTVGYGQSRRGEEPSYDQPRQKGETKVNAVSGFAFQTMFESRAAFDAYLTKLEDAAFVKARGDELWNEELYAYGQEVQVGGNTEVQGCYGDSGGALLQRVGDHYELVGVDSNGPSGNKNECILGERFVRADAQVIAETAARAAQAEPWSLVRCDDSGRESATCAASGDVAACRTSTYGEKTFRQRLERCGERSLVCKASNGAADCK